MTTTSHLSTSDLARLRRILSHRRDQLIEARSANRPAQRGIGDAEIEDGDDAERRIEQEGALRQASFDATLLAEIDRALAKAEAGTYGVSEESGAPIPLDRLEAIPWARRTSAEEERQEDEATDATREAGQRPEPGRAPG